MGADNAGVAWPFNLPKKYGNALDLALYHPRDSLVIFLETGVVSDDLK